MSTLDAGRELDALVAEKVMGYQWFDDPVTEFRYFRHPGNFNYGMIVGKQGTEAVNFYSLPRYSTDIAAAWIAADRMCEHYDCTIEVKRMASFMPGRRYGAIVCGGDLEYKRSDITAYGHSDISPAHALCLAMLEAIGALP